MFYSASPYGRFYSDAVPSAAKRSKEDLHEWSMYRQNLTSSIAEELLHLPGSVPLKECVLPYGNFQMNEQAVESVIRAGRLEDNQLGNKAETYLKFGLPRIAVHAVSTDSLHNFRRSEPSLFVQRSSQSEWDLRSSTRQFAREGLQGGSSAVEEDFAESALSSPVAHYAASDILPNNNRALNGFFQSDRHHAHYFSNIDLFQQPSGFNYLRYAKADELRRDTVSSSPCVKISNLSFVHDLRTNFERATLRSPRFLRTLSDVSFEISGGDTLAFLYTTEVEIRTLLRVISNRMVPRGVLDGSFELNGNPVNAALFGERVAFVPADDPYPFLTVKQALQLSCDFTKPATSAFKVPNMIEQLIHTLALSPFRNVLCGELAKTETQRLKIAMQVLKDTDILICENITKDMDVYDVAFVIDYLRDWAIKLNRIVIMAITPPTIEILHMFQKAAILASGQIVYFGDSSQMIEYFESVNFPCPMFKNPCDYYVDLVTLDHLTSEASDESSERIKQLINLWKRRAPCERSSPCESISPKIRKPNVFSAAFAIYRRFYQILFNMPSQFLLEPMCAFALSLVVGAIFFEIRDDRRGAINDRFGFIFSMLTIFIFPNLLINIDRVYEERSFLFSDVRNHFYGPTCYLVVKLLFDVPLAVVSYILHALPAYLLSGLPPENAFYWPSVFVFVIHVSLHCLLWRYIAWIFAYACRTQIAAAVIVGFLLSISAFSSGFSVHRGDQTPVARKIGLISPTRWTGQVLAENEFLRRSIIGDRIALLLFDVDPHSATELVVGCERRKILATKIKEVPIYTVSQCVGIKGSQALYFAGFNPENSNERSHFLFGIYVILAWFSVVLVMLFCVVRCNHKPEIRKL